MAIYRGASSAQAASIPDISGSLGVSAFFVVSGFLMVYVHGQDFGKRGSTKKFYARRIARIVPLYWVVTILYGAKQMYFSQDTFWHTIKSLLFIPYQTNGDLWRPVLGQGWTLNYEMAFYLVFGLALIFTRGIWIVFGVFSALAFLNTIGIFGPHNVFGFWSDPIVLYFLGGVAIGMLRARIRTGPSFVVALCSCVTIVSVAAWLGALPCTTPTLVALLIPLAAVSAVAVAALAREDFRQSWLRRLAKRIGDASYSIYLTHTFVIAPAAKIGVAKLFPEMPMLVFTPLMMLMTAIVGYAVFRCVEKPLIRIWTRTFIRRPNAPTAVRSAG